MTVRPYRAEDWARLCAIHDGARLEELQAAGLAEAFLPLPIAAEREGLFDYRVQVAEAQGQVLGFVADDGEELAWLYVDPAARRRGVGQALVAAVQGASPAGLTLELLEGNAAALAFYRVCGFVETSTHGGRMPGNEAFAVRVQCMRWPGIAP
ncbi:MULTISPECIES: GNAT family N-acetyltransferase [unclassified Xanthomonas]|uniref:GNAT family N-acetyltransferase n=1 Tax=unclassified Xanthomonas TaxID=2643310 RepID=UPI002A8056A1|nr:MULTISPECIES: GNAT family N-acetyltransferase [unclassified Xanthomonas]MDY4297708.1 GNAT family N-acetyltransferase [Xanthomonas sp. LF02-5]MDY4359502.1 GNAT family N-acetyltransferase [Xanthomonas sp. LF04-12]